MSCSKAVYEEFTPPPPDENFCWRSKLIGPGSYRFNALFGAVLKS